MKRRIPTALEAALSGGAWHNPGPDVLRAIFKLVGDLPDLQLYTELSTMVSVWNQVMQAGYVDDIQFCMVRKGSDLTSSEDPRLVMEDAMFVGGSIMPGDDVLVALDLRRDEDPRLLVFDWSKAIPARWVEIGRLSEVVSEVVRATTRG